MLVAENPSTGGPEGVRAPLSGDVLGSRRCPICLNAPLTSRQEVCSGRCWAAHSRRRNAEAPRERAAEIRAFLEMALDKLRRQP